MRQVVLDTETTGLETSEGHRIIEVGCVEIVDRRCTGKVLHFFINPERDIDEGALEVHGITREQLADKPVFAGVVEEMMDFLRGAELVIHNAPFDVGFINYELQRLDAGWGRVEDHCTILDTLVLARHKHPGQRVSLDALCKRYGIDNSARELHGALLDARLLAEVYLVMTGGQVGLSLGGDGAGGGDTEVVRRLPADRPALKVVVASDEERAAHRRKIEAISAGCEEGSLWERLDSEA